MESRVETREQLRKWFQAGGAKANTPAEVVPLPPPAPSAPPTNNRTSPKLTNQDVLLQTDYGTWHWVILFSIVLIILWYSLLQTANIQQVKKNWNKYRCSPTVLPFTSLYGYEISENFNYCVSGIMSTQLGKYLGPFGYILSTVLEGLMTFLKSLNNLRLMFASMVGGVGTIVQDLLNRMKLIMSQIKVTGLRLQNLFKRTFGVMYAIMYVGLSATTAGLNFADTTLFKFLDTFCFDGNTLLAVKSKGLIPIREIQLGDILEETGSVVTSTYSFMADGQPMMRFPSTKDYPYPIFVSTNHFVKDASGAWIQAKEHPEAVPVGDWSGGANRLLYCLDTDKHLIPIGTYVFSDYDETSAQDAPTMKWVEQNLNAHPPSPRKEYPWPYQPCLEPNAHVKTRDGTWKSLQEIRIGDELVNGRVIGKVHRHIHTWVQSTHGTSMTPSTLVWSERQTWERAGHLYSSHTSETPLGYIQLVVEGAVLELSTGEHIRDFVEYHSPEAESLVACCMRSDSDK